jgi:hypothetical protein
VVDPDAMVKGQFAENAWTVAIKRALEPIERAAAKERQRDNGRTAPGGNTPDKFPDLAPWSHKRKETLS